MTSSDQVTGSTGVLAKVTDLLQARTLVDFLLRRIHSEESHHATDPQFSDAPEAAIWQRLTDEQRQTVIDQLAHLVAKSAIGAARQEASDD